MARAVTGITENCDADHASLSSFFALVWDSSPKVASGDPVRIEVR